MELNQTLVNLRDKVHKLWSDIQTYKQRFLLKGTVHLFG